MSCAADAGADSEHYLLVWYIPPREKIMREDVDPAVVERLKALGYAW
jgi:hypothetical protein